jgi:hypothetical protein
MKQLLFGLAVLVMTSVTAHSALALGMNKFPPGPLGTCTDTMSINTLKTYLNNTLASCGAITPNTTGTVGDTVLGVGGIITGFDEIATGYDLYIQTSGGGVNTGLDVFTHGTNLRPVYGFQLGDSVIVEYACVANYYGDVELLSPNGNFSAPNIVFRKVSSGNPLPPFLHGNTTDFSELPGNTFFQSHISELVTLDGPVRIARLTGFFRGALVVRDAAPSDSVYIDYSKLTAIVPPAVGVYLTSVSGISNASSRGYRIMPRSAADIVDAQPAGLTDAYSVADDQYRIVFDRDVTPASATDLANYSLGSFGSVNSAAMDGTAAVVLTVTPGLSRGLLETITVNGVVGSANGIAMTTPASKDFVAGVLTCGELSTPDADSLLKVPCQDKSHYAGAFGDFTNGNFGPRSTMTGIVTGIYGNLYYMQDGATPLSPYVANARSRGITVFAPPTALTLGHRYVIAGADEEYYKENEFAAITYVSDKGLVGVPAPVALPVSIANYDTCDANTNLLDGRDYLSLLATLRAVTVVQRYTTLPSNGFHVVGPYPSNTDTVYIENQNAVLGANSTTNPNYPAVGSLIHVVGLMHYTTNTSTPSLRLCPRSPADITILTAPPLGVDVTPATLSFSVFPNPARTVNVAFTLPSSSNVTLGVYDLLGRQVASLADGQLAAGSYQKSWNGLDSNGNKVRSGVYFYRLRAGNEVRTARTMLVTQ